MSEPSLTPLNRTPIPVVVEPFGAHHNRTGFNCGNAFIDARLNRAVLPLHQLNLTRAFVAVEPEKTDVLGFYAMNPHEIGVWQAPPAWQGLIEQHTLGSIPAAYISLFATRERFQGRGIGTMMMADALRRIKKASQEAMGIFAVVLDAADQRAFDFYEKIGFQSMDGFRMFYPVSAIP